MTNVDIWRLTRGLYEPDETKEISDEKLIEEYCCSSFVQTPGDLSHCEQQENCYTCWRAECKKLDSATRYQRLALRTAKPDQAPYEQLEEALMGLCGESGEALDIFKKHKFQGHELNKEALARELGDVAWYLAVGAHALGMNLGEVFMVNIDKLHKRYPNGFEAERSVNRGTDENPT